MPYSQEEDTCMDLEMIKYWLPYHLSNGRAYHCDLSTDRDKNFWESYLQEMEKVKPVDDNMTRDL